MPILAQIATWLAKEGRWVAHSMSSGRTGWHNGMTLVPSTSLEHAFRISARPTQWHYDEVRHRAVNVNEP